MTNKMLNTPISGLISGLIATLPMTFFMNKLFNQLPWYEKSPLPPRKIRMKLAEDLGVKKHMSETQKYAATMIGHYSYGAGMGALYAPLAKKFHLDNTRGGILFGLVVWSASYLGFLPAVHLHRKATREPLARNALMIAAHIVWGIALARSFKELEHA
jgi:uncharacterized membrane protein YagU involved in acid resistance